MAARRKRTPPKRLFKARRLPASVVTGIHALTEGNPSLRAILLESVATLNDDAFLRAFALVPPHVRATLCLAFRDAVIGLRDRPCDFCPNAPARKVRFLAIGQREYARIVTPKPGQESFAGFTIVCAACARLTDAELGRRMVTEHADVLRQAAETPFRQPAILGARVGEAGELPLRHQLELCSDCQAMCFFDANQIDRLGTERRLYLCGPCSVARGESGRLEAVPLFILGGLS